jgi:hypothetical protein
MFNVGEFSARVAQRGFLQTNRYDVRIFFEDTALAGGFLTNPDLGNVSVMDVSRDLSYRCVSAALPGMTLKTADVNRMGLGVQEKMPYSGNFTDIQLSFLCDKYGAAYNFWYDWFNYIFSISGQSTNGRSGRAYYTTEYKDNYAATIEITVYDTTGRVAMQHILYKAFPTSISDIQVGWNNNNQLMKINTNITFREWSLDGGDAVLVAPSLNGIIVSTASAVARTVVNSIFR